MKSPSKEEQFKRQVLEQAKRLIAIFGYQALVMEDIARAVGKSRSTLYLYFKDKEAIFDYVIDNELSSYHADLKLMVDEQVPMNHVLSEFIYSKLAFVYAKIKEYKHLKQEMDVHPEILRRMLLISSPHDLTTLEKIISLGFRQGIFNNFEISQVDLTSKIILDCINGITSAMTDNDSNITSLSKNLSNLLISGLTGKK